MVSMGLGEYVKGDLDFGKNMVIEKGNWIGFDVGGGIGVG